METLALTDTPSTTLVPHSQLAATPVPLSSAARPPAAGGPGGGDSWLVNLRNYYSLHNVLSQRPELPLWIIRWDGKRKLEWMELSDPRQRVKPFHFEIHYGKEEARDEFYIECLAKAQRLDDFVVEDLYGFWDLFYPIPSDTQGHTFLHAQQFSRGELSWEDIAVRWRKLTGQEPASANPDFLRFVRMALSLPLIDDELMVALKELIRLYSQQLTGETNGMAMHDQVDALNRDFFSRLWPYNEWIDSAISSEKFHLTPWYLEGELTEWMQEGMGITRLPTTTMCLMPVDSKSDAIDPVKTLLRNAQIQRACIKFARELPETAATKLQDYGVSLITSASRGKSAARARLELRERAQKLQDFVSREFGVRSVVGIGRSLPPGSPLYTSHREAVLALHLCVQLEKPTLFYDEHYGGEEFRYSQLQRAASALMDAFTKVSDTEIKLAADQYVRLVLMHSDERIEVVRSQFLAMLFQLLSAIQRRHPMRADAADRFAADLSRKLEESHTVFQVIESFKEALGRLSFVSSKALEGPKVMRLEATLQHLRENFAEPLRLPDVARKAGFSVPAFSRVFKQATGTSFLAYLRAIRVEHAKKLLMTTPLTTEQIAQACGFQSQHHLIRSFKKVTSQTPGAYRKAHATTD